MFSFKPFFLFWSLLLPQLSALWRYGEVVGIFYRFFGAVVPPCAVAVPGECSQGWNRFSRAVPGICGAAVAAGWRCADADGNRNGFRNLSPLQKSFESFARETNFVPRGINIHFLSWSLVLSDVFQSSLFVGWVLFLSQSSENSVCFCVSPLCCLILKEAWVDQWLQAEVNLGASYRNTQSV